MFLLPCGFWVQLKYIVSLSALVFNFIIGCSIIAGCSCLCLFFVFRDEPFHGTGDYSVPYGGVPAHHSAWPHPDVQQLQASQQDTRPQRYKMTEYEIITFV